MAGGLLRRVSLSKGHSIPAFPFPGALTSGFFPGRAPAATGCPAASIQPDLLPPRPQSRRCPPHPHPHPQGLSPLSQSAHRERGGEDRPRSVHPLPSRAQERRRPGMSTQLAALVAPRVSPPAFSAGRPARWRRLATPPPCSLPPTSSPPAASPLHASGAPLPAPAPRHVPPPPVSRRLVGCPDWAGTASRKRLPAPRPPPVRRRAGREGGVGGRSHASSGKEGRVMQMSGGTECRGRREGVRGARSWPGKLREMRSVHPSRTSRTVCAWVCRSKRPREAE